MQDHQGEFADLDQKFRNGANWFYWVAALSLINSLIVLFGGGWAFIFGLGTTQVVDALGAVVVEEFPDSVLMIKGGAFVISLVLLGVAGVFGWLAHKGIVPVFIIGIVLYCLDGLLFVIGGDILGLLFHGFVAYQMMAGLQALRQLHQVVRRAAVVDAHAQGAPVPPVAPGA